MDTPVLNAVRAAAVQYSTVVRYAQNSVGVRHVGVELLAVCLSTARELNCVSARRARIQNESNKADNCSSQSLFRVGK